MRQRSKKMQKIEAKYSQLRREFLAEYPLCQAALHKCTNNSTEVHHKKGRGIYHNDL